MSSLSSLSSRLPVVPVANRSWATNVPRLKMRALEKIRFLVVMRYEGDPQFRLQCLGPTLDARRRICSGGYWLTNTIGSSIRRYYADAHAEQRPTEQTTTPTSVAIFAQDFQTIRRLAERDHANIVSWNRYERCSHLAPHDASDLLLEDIRQFFRALR